MTSPRLIFIELYLSNNDVPSLPHHQKSHTQPNLTDMLATLTKNEERDRERPRRVGDNTHDNNST